MKLFVELPSGEKIEVEDFIEVFVKETFKLSSSKPIKVSGDDQTGIDNYGKTADVRIFSIGRHRLKINHRVIYVVVKEFVPVATSLNIEVLDIVDVGK